jgi:citrate lyase beta subunit
MGSDAMLAACRHAFHMGYRGALVIHPAWVKAANEGFKPSDSEIEMTRKVKSALDEAYAKGQGAVSVEGRMYDMADMKHVNRLLERADALARKEAEKAAAVEAAGGID